MIRLNAEKTVCLLAFAALVVGGQELLVGVWDATENVPVVSSEVAAGRANVVWRGYRRFENDRPIARSPFTYAEGWDLPEAVPIDPPLLPPLKPRLPPLSMQRGGGRFNASHEDGSEEAEAEK